MVLRNGKMVGWNTWHRECTRTGHALLHTQRHFVLLGHRAMPCCRNDKFCGCHGGFLKFSVIYADPAWTYQDKALAGDRGAGCKYDLMTDTDLYSLPVSQLAAPDCSLFLWVTMPKLQEGLDCLKSWGFTYKTNAFTWVKTNNSGTPYFMGMGRWTRANAELCLFGVKGKPKRESAGVNSIIAAPRAKHSAKPAETRDRIVRLMGDIPRVELFARETVPGWVSLGNDIDGADLRESVPDLAEL